jgi:hypothetical protein
VKVFRRVLGVVLTVAAGILVVTAILTFTHVGPCGDIGEQACPSGVTTAAGEIVGGIVLLVIGSIMTVGAGILIFLFVGGIYAWLRAVNGGYGLMSSDGIVVVSFLAIPALLFLWGLGSVIFGKGGNAAPDDFKKRAIRADGVIAEIADTGTTINDDPRVKLTIDYVRADGTTARIEHRQLVSRLAIPRPGERVTVWYDPDGDRTELEYDPAAAAPIVDAAGGGMVAELERLAVLHRDGALTAAEYARAKERLLG